MKCQSCGSSEYVEADGYNICQYCGSTTKLKKDNFYKSILFFLLLLIAMFIFYPKEKVNVLKQTIKTQVVVNQPPKYIEKNKKSSISINNTNSNIGTQSITFDNNPIELDIDNNHAEIEMQNIRRIGTK